MKEDYKDYLALLTILVFAFVSFVYFGYQRQFQTVVIILTSILYFLWGIAYHLKKGDFHPRLVFEYLAVAFFAAALLLVLLGRV
ncbi:hypothetical protein ACFLZP_03865 [Patescibacteria group bacterium]